MSSFLKNITKSVLTNKEVIEAGCVGDVTGYINSGSYVFNALLSGSLYGGFPSNKITGLSGLSGVGKTYYALQAIEAFLDAHPDNVVVLFDSETAIESKMFEQRGIDTSRIIVETVNTIETFRHKSLNLVMNYAKEMKDYSEPRMLLVLDSLGQLSSNKEVGDIESGSDKRDMTKAQLIKGGFRVLTEKCGLYNIPFIVTNHVYSSMGLFPTTVQAGGNGLVYSASTIIVFGKGKEKEGTDIVGAIISAKTAKARFTKQDQVVKTRLSFETGLDKWYGMDDFADKSGAIEKKGNMFLVPNDKGEMVKKFGKAMMKEPEKYFTEEVMEKIEKWVKATFLYGSDAKSYLDLADGEELESTDVE
jgi:RecA/RadA recombinase